MCRTNECPECGAEHVCRIPITNNGSYETDDGKIEVEWGEYAGVRMPLVVSVDCDVCGYISHLEEEE